MPLKRPAANSRILIHCSEICHDTLPTPTLKSLLLAATILACPLMLCGADPGSHVGGDRDLGADRTANPAALQPAAAAGTAAAHEAPVANSDETKNEL